MCSRQKHQPPKSTDARVSVVCAGIGEADIINLESDFLEKLNRRFDPSIDQSSFVMCTK